MSIESLRYEDGDVAKEGIPADTPVVTPALKIIQPRRFVADDATVVPGAATPATVVPQQNVALGIDAGKTSVGGLGRGNDLNSAETDEQITLAVSVANLYTLLAAGVHEPVSDEKFGTFLFWGGLLQRLGISSEQMTNFPDFTTLEVYIRGYLADWLRNNCSSRNQIELITTVLQLYVRESERLASVEQILKQVTEGTLPTFLKEQILSRFLQIIIEELPLTAFARLYRSGVFTMKSPHSDFVMETAHGFLREVAENRERYQAIHQQFVEQVSTLPDVPNFSANLTTVLAMGRGALSSGLELFNGADVYGGLSLLMQLQLCQSFPYRESFARNEQVHGLRTQVDKVREILGAEYGRVLLTVLGDTPRLSEEVQFLLHELVRHRWSRQIDIAVLMKILREGCNSQTDCAGLLHLLASMAHVDSSLAYPDFMRLLDSYLDTQSVSQADKDTAVQLFAEQYLLRPTVERVAELFKGMNQLDATSSDFNVLLQEFVARFLEDRRVVRAIALDVLTTTVADGRNESPESLSDLEVLTTVIRKMHAQLMATLLDLQGKVVKKIVLLAKYWGYDPEANSVVLSVTSEEGYKAFESTALAVLRDALVTDEALRMFFSVLKSLFAGTSFADDALELGGGTFTTANNVRKQVCS